MISDLPGVDGVSRFVILSTAFLGWAFYEVSGGADFEPAKRPIPRDQMQTGATGAETATTPALKSAPQPVSLGSFARVDTTRDAPARYTLSFSGAEDGSEIALDPAALVQPAALVTDEPAPAETPGADQEATPAEPDEATATLPARPRVTVSGSRVNLRNGPGTRYAVLGRLTLGDAAEILRENGNGWTKIRVIDSGRIGWMSSRFLEPAAE